MIQEKVSQWEEAQDIKSFLDDLGMAIMEVRGGSAGPLYGTLIGGLGVDLNDGENTLDAEGVKRMFTGCLSEMEDITTAKVRDKTMMDALIPAVEAAQKTEGSVKIYWKRQQKLQKVEQKTVKNMFPNLAEQEAIRNRPLAHQMQGLFPHLFSFVAWQMV